MSSDKLWRAYAQGDASARDALLQANLSLVHHVARQLSRALAAPADFDELVSCGTIGLMNALEAFEPARGLIADEPDSATAESREAGQRAAAVATE